MKLHYIQTGEAQIKSRHRQARHEARLARMADVLMDPNWTPRLPIGCWLIEHPEGLIVVDTGESSHANDPGYISPGGIPSCSVAGAAGSSRKKRLVPNSRRWASILSMCAG
jgi:hypothetical protein